MAARMKGLTMSRRVVVLLALGAIMVSGGPAALAADPVSGFTSDQQRALDFREMFGLDAAQSLVIAASRDPGYSADNYGVPLSRPEEAEMQRRVQVEWDVQAAANAASQLSNWGGYWFDQLNRGVPVFQFVGDSNEARAQLGKLLPRGIEYRVVPVKHSLNELKKLKYDVVAAWPELRSRGVDIVSTGIDVKANRVVAGISGLTDSASSIVGARFGPTVRVVERKRGRADACPPATAGRSRVASRSSENSATRARPA